MKDRSFYVGFGFGITSAVITTLGLIVGLHSGTHSQAVVLGAIFTIAVADAFSDSLATHVSKESENRHTAKEIWIASLGTFMAKFLFALTFAIPVFFLDLPIAIIVCIIWGLLILGIFSYIVGEDSKGKPWSAVGEHLSIAICVIIVTHYLGDWIGANFN